MTKENKESPRVCIIESKLEDITTDLQVLPLLAGIHRSQPLQAVCMNNTHYVGISRYCEQNEIVCVSVPLTATQTAADIQARQREYHWTHLAYIGSLDAGVLSNLLKQKGFATETHTFH